jgi:hypothetical protein
VRYAEAVIDFAGELGFRTSRLNIYFTSDDEKTRVGNVGGAVINPESVHSLGAIVNYMSLRMFLIQNIETRALPAWLSAGLELYWLENLGIEHPAAAIDRNFDLIGWGRQAAERGLPPIGDAWFVPGLINDALAKDAPQAAYAMVKFLSEAGMLRDAIFLYTNNSDAMTITANGLLEEHWAAMTGIENPAPKYVSNYYFNFFDSRHAEMMTAHGGRGRYALYIGDWDYETLKLYIDMTEAAAVYINDWLNADSMPRFRMDLVPNPDANRWQSLHPLSQRNIRAYANPRSNYIYIAEPDLRFFAVMAHEMAHLLAYAAGFVSDEFTDSRGVRFFDEGLAQLLAVSFAAQNEVYAVNKGRDLRDLSENFYSSPDQRNIIVTFYELISGRPYSDDPLDFVVFDHLSSLLSIIETRNAVSERHFRGIEHP